MSAAIPNRTADRDEATCVFPVAGADRLMHHVWRALERLVSMQQLGGTWRCTFEARVGAR